MGRRDQTLPFPTVLPGANVPIKSLKKTLFKNIEQIKLSYQTTQIIQHRKK